MTTKTPQEIGKDFEETTRLILKALTLKRKSMFHRLYDTHSAGAYLPEQPADFLFMYEGKLTLIECKSSAKYETFPAGLSSLMEKEKAPLIRMWLRAGARCLFVFLSQSSGMIEFWDGKDVIAARTAERGRLDKTKIRLKILKKDYERMLEVQLLLWEAL